MFLIHTPPEHAEIVARAVVSACRLDGWHSPVQPKLLHTLFNRLLGQDLDFEKIEPLSPAEVAATLCTPAEREELIHLMVAIEILYNPIPERLERSVVQWATTLHVHERSLLYARELARGALTKAVHDFYRLNWIGDLDRRSPEFEALLRHAGDKVFALTVEADATEAARWTALSSCPQAASVAAYGSSTRCADSKFPANSGRSIPRSPNTIGSTCLPTMAPRPWVKSKSSAFRLPPLEHLARCLG